MREKIVQPNPRHAAFSAALARALEEARDELLECKADYHRNPSSVIDKCNAVLAEARSLLAPKEDTDA